MNVAIPPVSIGPPQVRPVPFTGFPWQSLNVATSGRAPPPLRSRSWHASGMDRGEPSSRTALPPISWGAAFLLPGGTRGRLTCRVPGHTTD